MLEGIRGFVPASQLSLSYIENLEDYLLQEVDLQVIDVDQAANRLVLSARELLRAKERKAKEALLAKERYIKAKAFLCGEENVTKFHF